MKDLIALMDRESKDWMEVEQILHQCNCRIHCVRSLEELQREIKRADWRIAIVDLDLASIPNRFFRSLKAESPDLSILALSGRTFHPELKEAMTHHICACFRKPVEADEFIFWLKAVGGEEKTRR